MTLEVKNLSFAYRTSKVLDDVSFCANDGDFIALIGPNGVGKSTLFKCILGFLTGYTGQILVDGKNTKDIGRAKLAREIAYIPQSTSQVFDYTALELVLMGKASQLKSYENPSKKDEEDALSVMHELGIEELSTRGCGEISGGEYQLVMLARALVQKAKILVMDEPTANLDFGNQFKVMKKANELAESGFIILTSTHDPNQVFLHANRALVLSGGKLVEDGAPASVLSDEVLSELYGVRVKRCDVVAGRKSINVCVPVGNFSDKKDSRESIEVC